MRRKRRPEPKQLEPGANYAGVYRAAAQRIRKSGWCHRGGLDRDGRVCLLIAICGAAKDFVGPEGAAVMLPAQYAAQQLDPRARAGSAYALIAWNDAPERTEAEVLAFLDQLAA